MLFRSATGNRIISISILKFADTDYFYGRPDNLAILWKVCLHRKSLLQTCKLSRQVALEMWRKDIRVMEEGESLYGCPWRNGRLKEQILQFPDRLLQ